MIFIPAVNECDMIAGVCENGKCMDTKKSYMCMCNPGFKLSMDGKKCTGKSSVILIKTERNIICLKLACDFSLNRMVFSYILKNFRRILILQVATAVSNCNK